PAFIDRVKEYVIKAIREAKVNSGWLRPNSAYEEAFLKFVDNLLKDEKDNEFLESFRQFQHKIKHYGVFNSLSKTLLKITSPGLPDIYQGTELLDLSLVDPDNRRPVDYEKRKAFLAEIKRKVEGDILCFISEMMDSPEDGKIKMFLIYQALKARGEHLEIFQREIIKKYRFLAV
ncbi:MAG: malto-oligosyltrehalose synthase, partial [Okeania sp. SIO2H7]|nr:malto-oligosyltrehalose synthase [Okeania sp. SIO2H7]